MDEFAPSPRQLGTAGADFRRTGGDPGGISGEYSGQRPANPDSDGQAS
jgi:hypothetical protein